MRPIPGVDTDHLRSAAVGQAYLHGSPFADDVQAGRNETLRSDNKSRADALLGAVTAPTVNPDNGRAGFVHQLGCSAASWFCSGLGASCGRFASGLLRLRLGVQRRSLCRGQSQKAEEEQGGAHARSLMLFGTDASAGEKPLKPTAQEFGDVALDFRIGHLPARSGGC